MPNIRGNAGLREGYVTDICMQLSWEKECQWRSRGRHTAIDGAVVYSAIMHSEQERAVTKFMRVTFPGTTFTTIHDVHEDDVHESPGIHKIHEVSAEVYIVSASR